MTLAALAAPPGNRPAPRDQRLALVLTLSVLAHVGLILAMLLAGRDQTPASVSHEIPVEIVQAPEEPKATPRAETPPDHPKSQPARAEREKPAAHQPAPPKPAVPEPPAATPKREATKPPPPAPAQHEVAERMERLLGPMPAVALPSASDTGTDAVSYQEAVLSQIAKAKKEGRYSGIPGVATVSFSLGDQGEVLRCEVVRKSVDPALDAEAMAMVRRAAPYPTPPPGADRGFVIGLRFQAIP